MVQSPDFFINQDCPGVEELCCGTWIENYKTINQLKEIQIIYRAVSET